MPFAGLRLQLQPLVSFHLNEGDDDSIAQTRAEEAVARPTEPRLDDELAARKAMDALNIGGSIPKPSEKPQKLRGSIGLVTMGEGHSLAFRFERSSPTISLEPHPPLPGSGLEPSESQIQIEFKFRVGKPPFGQ